MYYIYLDYDAEELVNMFKCLDWDKLHRAQLPNCGYCSISAYDHDIDIDDFRPEEDISIGLHIYPSSSGFMHEEKKYDNNGLFKKEYRYQVSIAGAGMRMDMSVVKKGKAFPEGYPFGATEVRDAVYRLLWVL